MGRGEIVGGIFVAIAAAAILAAVSGVWEAAWVKVGGGDEGNEPPPVEVIGTWTFDRFEPGPPPEPESEMEPEIQYRSLQLLDDGDFIATFRMSFAGDPGVEGRSSGTYRVDNGTIKFESEGNQSGLSALEWAVDGDELELTDRASDLTLVFQRF